MSSFFENRGCLIFSTPPHLARRLLTPILLLRGTHTITVPKILLCVSIAYQNLGLSCVGKLILRNNFPTPCPSDTNPANSRKSRRRSHNSSAKNPAGLWTKSQRLIILDSSSITMDSSPMPESLLWVAKLSEQRRRSEVKEKIEANMRIFCRISTPYHLGFARHHNSFYPPQIFLYLHAFEIFPILNKISNFVSLPQPHLQSQNTTFVQEIK